MASPTVCSYEKYDDSSSWEGGEAYLAKASECVVSFVKETGLVNLVRYPPAEWWLTHMSKEQSVCLSVSLSVCLYVLRVYVFVCQSVCLCKRAYVCMPQSAPCVKVSMCAHTCWDFILWWAWESKKAARPLVVFQRLRYPLLSEILCWCLPISLNSRPTHLECPFLEPHQDSFENWMHLLLPLHRGHAAAAQQRLARCGLHADRDHRHVGTERVRGNSVVEMLYLQRAERSIQARRRSSMCLSPRWRQVERVCVVRPWSGWVESRTNSRAQW